MPFSSHPTSLCCPKREQQDPQGPAWIQEGPFQSFSLFSTPPPRLTRLFKEGKNSRVKALLPPHHPHPPSLHQHLSLRMLPCGTLSPVPASLLEKHLERFSPFFFFLFFSFFNSLGDALSSPGWGGWIFHPGKLSGSESREFWRLWANRGGKCFVW